MSVSRRREARVLDATETALVQRSHRPELAEVDDTGLAELTRLLRDRRDRARDVSRRQRREVRGKAAPPARVPRPTTRAIAKGGGPGGGRQKGQQGERAPSRGRSTPQLGFQRTARPGDEGGSGQSGRQPAVFADRQRWDAIDPQSEGRTLGSRQSGGSGDCDASRRRAEIASLLSRRTPPF